MVQPVPHLSRDHPPISSGARQGRQAASRISSATLSAAVHPAVRAIVKGVDQRPQFRALILDQRLQGVQPTLPFLGSRSDPRLDIVQLVQDPILGRSCVAFPAVHLSTPSNRVQNSGTPRVL